MIGFQGVANFPPPRPPQQPVIGFPQPVPPLGSAEPSAFAHGYQAVPGTHYFCILQLFFSILS